MAYSLGDSVSGVVSGVTGYGAFVRLPDGSTGMIHISKLSRDFISDIRSVIKKDDVVTATVISVTDGKIALSLIGDNPKRERSAKPVSRTESDFESMLSSFKSASDEKLASLNRSSRDRRKKR
jgi:predicted RNA-binding protein with RPS1 domain